MTDSKMPTRVIVCQGPPLCLLEGDAAIQHAVDGCFLCKIDEYDPVADEWITVQDIARA